MSSSTNATSSPSERSTPVLRATFSPSSRSCGSYRAPNRSASARPSGEGPASSITSTSAPAARACGAIDASATSRYAGRPRVGITIEAGIGLGETWDS